MEANRAGLIGITLIALYSVLRGIAECAVLGSAMVTTSRAFAAGVDLAEPWPNVFFNIEMLRLAAPLFGERIVLGVLPGTLLLLFRRRITVALLGDPAPKPPGVLTLHSLFHVGFVLLGSYLALTALFQVPRIFALDPTLPAAKAIILPLALVSPALRFFAGIALLLSSPRVSRFFAERL